MIEARHIAKRFRDRQALRDLNFSVEKGEILCIMGANGAGKSTLFNIIATLDDEYEGTLRVRGMDIRENKRQVRKILGYVSGRFSLYGDLTVAENLSFFAAAYGGNPREVRRQCPGLWHHLESSSRKQAKHLSGGMKQKLAICCALVHEPRLLLLDEPTTGIDPFSRNLLWKELKSLQKGGMTILVSTHYLEEAAIADRVLFIHEGQPLKLGFPGEIVASYPRKLFTLGGYPVQPLFYSMKELPGVINCYIRGEHVYITAAENISLEEIGVLAAGRGFAKLEIEQVSPDMEDVFIDCLSTNGEKTML
jgi:ABC-type multidrug transport system ATPase subunit